MMEIIFLPHLPGLCHNVTGSSTLDPSDYVTTQETQKKKNDIKARTDHSE